MGVPFLLNGLFSVWAEGLVRNEPTVTFEIQDGQGRFLFMMFFDPEDEKTKDNLLLFLQNTRHMLSLKLYGAHKRGEFQVYLGEREIDAIKRELQVGKGNGVPFDIAGFIEGLNSKIPGSLPLAKKIEILRANLGAISGHLGDIVEFAEKTELIGEVQLPSNKQPQEKTIRKLYLYSTDSPDVVANYIANLKMRNCTLAWRAPK